MHIATDFLLDGLLGAENFHPSQYASDLSFCAEPKVKSQNPSTRVIKYCLDRLEKNQSKGFNNPAEDRQDS